MSLSESLALFSSLISTVEVSKRRLLFTWLISDPPGSHILFSILVAPSLLLDGVLGDIEDGTDGAFHLGDLLIFPGILLRVTFFRIGLGGVVSALVSFRRDMMYALAWLSVGNGGGFSLGDLDCC